jgi:hypothetical protein
MRAYYLLEDLTPAWRSRAFRVAVIEKLADDLGVLQQTLLKVTKIAPATLKSASGLLSPEESDWVYRVAAAYRSALRLFEGEAESATALAQRACKGTGRRQPTSASGRRGRSCRGTGPHRSPGARRLHLMRAYLLVKARYDRGRVDREPSFPPSRFPAPSCRSNEMSSSTRPMQSSKQSSPRRRLSRSTSTRVLVR